MHDLCVAEDAKQVLSSQDAKQTSYHPEHNHQHDHTSDRDKWDRHKDDHYKNDDYFRHDYKMEDRYKDYEFRGNGDQGFKCSKAEACPYVQTLQSNVKSLASVLSEVILETTNLGSRVSVLENFVFGGQPQEFNKTECLARGPFNTTFGPSNTSRWVADAFFPANDGQEICNGRIKTAATCNSICGNIGLRCDPCGMMQASCSSNLAQALDWAARGETPTVPSNWRDRDDIRFDNQSPGPCPSTEDPTAGGCVVGATCPQDGNPLSDSGSIGFSQAVCETGGSPIITSVWFDVQNMVNSTRTDFIDPQNVCNLPIWTLPPAPEGAAPKLTWSALCYCNGVVALV